MVGWFTLANKKSSFYNSVWMLLKLNLNQIRTCRWVLM